MVYEVSEDLELSLARSCYFYGDSQIFKIQLKYNKKISKWKSEKDKSIYDAFNKGMKISNGEFICIVNSKKSAMKYFNDDKLAKKHIELYEEILKKY